MPRRKTLPAQITCTITKLSGDGRGITHIDQKITFVQNALPGETVSCQITGRHRRYFEASASEVLANPHPDRIPPPCPYFSLCGGCQLQHMHHAAQLRFKEQEVLEKIQHQAGVLPRHVLPPIAGHPLGYRSRARLGVRYVRAKESALVGFREKNGRYLTNMESCAVLDQRVSNLIPALRTLITEITIRDWIPQIEVATDENIIAFIVRHMEPFSETDITRWIDFARMHNIHLYFQPCPEETIHQVYPQTIAPLLAYDIPESNLRLSYRPTDFVQINRSVNPKMIAQAIALLELSPKDRVLDLFCGIGNFSLPIARQAASVTGVEGSESSVARARMNARDNSVNNANFFVGNLFTTQEQADWWHQSFQKILLDPPRTGAEEIVMQIEHFSPSVLVYISCNPDTFARDCDILVNQKHYTLDTVGIIDMFPHTKHTEVIARFTR